MRKSYLILLVAAFTLSACTTKNVDTAVNGTSTKGMLEKLVLEDGKYQVDLEASNLYWEAFKAVGGHMGGVEIKSGELNVRDGRLKNGSFKIDMNSITVTGEEGVNATNVANRLMSDDFLSSSDYPEARLDTTRIKIYEGDEPYTHIIDGDLSLRGITAEVKVMVNVEMNDGIIFIKGKTEIDRTIFAIKTRSASYFENLGDSLVEDVFTLELDIVARTNE